MVDYLFGNAHAMYDVSLDDQRFVMLRSGADNDDTQLILVENWVEALRQRSHRWFASRPRSRIARR